MNPPSAAVLESVQDFARSSHKLLIGGKWVEAQTDQQIATRDPSTDGLLGHAPEAAPADVDAAVAAARHCFETDWGQRAPQERAKILLKTAQLIDQHRDKLAALETLDNGTLFSVSSSALIDIWIGVLEYFAGWPSKTAGQTLPAPNRYMPPGAEATLYTLKEPLGVVGAILPWNAPGTFLINKVAPAFAAGCTLVVKPAEQTPLSALYLAQLFQEAGLPPGALNIVTGYGHTVGAALSKHGDVNKISFTGSSAVGKLIARDAADSLKRLTLELGGKSAFIVMDDADLDIAAGAAAGAGFFQAGQFCMCPSRIFVERSVVSKFIEKLTAHAANLKIGAAIEPSTQLTPLITEEQRQRVASYVEKTKAEGAEVLIGGGPADRDGYYFNPTLFFHPNTNLTIGQEEIFGPVLLIVPFDGSDHDQLAKIANETRFGLAASVWTRSLANGHRMVKRLKAGVIGVNSHGVTDPVAPFGGVKDSGLGREFGQEGYESFLETKTALIVY